MNKNFDLIWYQTWWQQNLTFDTKLGRFFVALALDAIDSNEKL